MVVNYILPISCLLFWRSWFFPNSTILSRVINSLYITKTYLIRHAYMMPAKISFCWLKVWIIINNSQLQLVFHGIIEKYSCSSDDKEYVFHDCAECLSGKLYLLPDSNPDWESDLDSNSDSCTSCLVSFYHWVTPDKHVTKIDISESFQEATERFKESVVSLERYIYSKRSQNRHYNHVKEFLDRFLPM